VVRTILNNGMSIRKTLTYSGCSKNMYYNNNKSRKNNYRNHIASSSSIEENIQQISLQRPTYGTRRMAAMLTRILGRPVNRKRVQRIFRKMGYITPSRSKKEIIRSKVSTIKADRPNQVWEADLTYVHCVVLMDGATYSTYLTYLQENGLATVLTCLQSRKMQSFLLKMLL